MRFTNAVLSYEFIKILKILKKKIVFCLLMAFLQQASTPAFVVLL